MIEENLLQPKKRKKLSVCVKPHLDNGLTKDFSQQLEHLEVRDSTISSHSYLTSLQPPTKKKVTIIKTTNNVFVTAGSLQMDKKKISKDKSLICKKSSRTIKSSQTLVQESTSKEKDFAPCWSLHAKDLSQRLWLPTETDFVDSPSNSWNGSFTSMESNSWFSMKSWTPRETKNWQKTSLQSSTFSLVESMVKENTRKEKTRTNNLRKSKKPVANISRKVGLRPSPEVANILRRWFGCVRHTYNWALGCIKSKTDRYKLSVTWLRKRFINEVNIPKSKRYLLDCPKHVRDTAIVDLVEAYASNFKKKKKNPSHTFNLKFRKSKDDQSVTITSESIKAWNISESFMRMYPSYISNKIKLHTKKNKLPENIDYDCKLLMDKLGRFSMIITYHVDPCENQTDVKHEWCSIDPGVRTMLTVYSPTNGVCYKVGDRDISRIFRLCKGLDNLISTTSKTKNKKSRRRMKRSQIKLRNRIKNLVKEVHCKSVKFLVSNFKNIIIPPFQVSRMVKRDERKITKSCVRKMVCWCHYGFRMRLIDVAKRCNVSVNVLGEEYTSKTCTHCHNVKHNLGGAKLYKCQSCGLIADRDVCGARNIFIKNIKIER